MILCVGLNEIWFMCAIYFILYFLRYILFKRFFVPSRLWSESNTNSNSNDFAKKLRVTDRLPVLRPFSRIFFGFLLLLPMLQILDLVRKSYEFWIENRNQSFGDWMFKSSRFIVLSPSPFSSSSSCSWATSEKCKLKNGNKNIVNQNRKERRLGAVLVASIKLNFLWKWIIFFFI